MSVWDNRLWLGTLDWSYSAEQGTVAIYQGGNQPIPVNVTLFFAIQNYGADLYFFQSSQSPAVPENVYGLGNYTSYGVRNSLPSLSNSLFLGMANISNLLTSPFGPQGGWELIELQHKAGSAPLNLLTGFSCAPATITGAGTTVCTATTSQPATAGLSIGVVPIAPSSVTVTAPLTFPVTTGQTTASVNVGVDDVAASTNILLEAGLNGGTWIAPLTINPGVPQISAAVADKGTQSPGVMYLDITLTDTGNGRAQPVTLTNIVLRTLGGTGTVTVAAASPAMPLNAGNLAVGGQTTVRLYLNVPSTVTRFSIAESGTVKSLSGTTYNFSNAQSVFP